MRARASIEQREAPIREWARDVHTHTNNQSKHTRARAQRRAETTKSPSDQQCGNSERLRAILCESRTTRAATSDLLISLSLRARSLRYTNFPERRNRTDSEQSPDVLRIRLALSPFPAIYPVVQCRDWMLPDRLNPFNYLAIVTSSIRFCLRPYSNVKSIFFRRLCIILYTK